ncbi:MAG: thymidylate synthase [Candidatus Nanohaloarchaea archaeon]
MEQYHNLVRSVLENGNYKPNRTAIDTISKFGHFHRVDVSEGFPLLTTKDLSGYRWNSLIHELLWYFSGEEHIRNLREHTSIWDEWATEEGNLETAYGRFWRRYPVPVGEAQLEGEAWADGDTDWVNREGETFTIDQIQYVIDQLKNNPKTRRLVVNAWHPANAEVSKLPPCHVMFIFNVQDGRLNLHLTQRSCDIALGVPFNIACYSLILKIIAKQTDLEVGEFAHSLVDAHIYCGGGERGRWYGEFLEELSTRVREVENRQGYLKVRDWIQDNAPTDNEDRKDHIPGMLEQLSREPRERPEMEVPDKPIDEMEYEDFQLKNYNPHPGIKFGIAE